jgi:hypothetical protein
MPEHDPLWMLYAFSLAFGLLSGFFLPASRSIVPGTSVLMVFVAAWTMRVPIVSHDAPAEADLLAVR